MSVPVNGENRRVRAGLLGLGTVGSGFIKALAQNGESIRQRTGCEIEIPYILVRNPSKERNVKVKPEQITTDPGVILSSTDIPVVIEVMGGIEPARTIILSALRAGKHVITANKELLAKHGPELLRAAEESGVQLLFEASVAGGIPVIRFLQGYLTANRVHEVSGILNGTTNYILTQMEQTGQSFAEVLAKAQELGYAEADPTSDVEGFDAAYKLAILTNLAYDVQVSPYEIPREGITSIQPLDLKWAREFGYVIKLIGRSRRTEAGIDVSVGPVLLPMSHPLARVNDVFNAVTISGDVVGDLTFIGKGAGEYPTASAVLEDLTALLRQPGQVLRSPNWETPVYPDVNQEAVRPFFVRFKAIVDTFAHAEHQFRLFITRSGGRIVRETGMASAKEAVGGYVVTGLEKSVLQAFLTGGMLEKLLHEPPLLIPCAEDETIDCQDAAFAAEPGLYAKSVEFMSQSV